MPQPSPMNPAYTRAIERLPRRYGAVQLFFGQLGQRLLRKQGAQQTQHEDRTWRCRRVMILHPLIYRGPKQLAIRFTKRAKTRRTSEPGNGGSAAT